MVVLIVFGFSHCNTQHPTRDFDALEKPSAHAALIDTASSSCDQVESTVKAVEVAQIPRRVTRHRKGEESAAQAEARSQAEIDRTFWIFLAVIYFVCCVNQLWS
jgi:hypothetical protein